MELSKKEKARVIELENRLSEITKKYDDSKKAYFKSKEERERLRQEVDRFKSEGVKESELSAAVEVSNKYEQIKIKYRVSQFSFTIGSINLIIRQSFINIGCSKLRTKCKQPKNVYPSLNQTPKIKLTNSRSFTSKSIVYRRS